MHPAQEQHEFDPIPATDRSSRTVPEDVLSNMSDAGANKKRGAIRQLTKDDDPDAEEEETPADGGTFKKASAEVLATRKIIKVRRQASATEPTGPNPFANIQLVPLTVPSSTNAQPTEPVTKPADTTDANQAVPETVPEPGAKAVDTVVDDTKDENVNGNGKVAADSEPTENGEKEAHTDTPKTFQQASSAQNAFGSFGTTFASSGFTFGLSTGGSASSFSTGTLPSFSFGSTPSPSAFSFGGSSSSPAFTSFGSSNPSSSSSPVPAPQSTVSLQEVHVETGEEKEKAVFTADAILYEFVDKSWKERGKGELKMNLSEDMKARLVMRSKGNLKLLLNASLFPDMRVSKMDNRSVTFACVNSAVGKEGAVLTTYAVKLRDPAGIPEFLSLIETHKGAKSQDSKESGEDTKESGAGKDAKESGAGKDAKESGAGEDATIGEDAKESGEAVV